MRCLKSTVALAALLVLCTGCVEKTWVEKEPALKAMTPLTAELAYPIAKARALQWQPDAFLRMVIVWYRGDNMENEPDRLIYAFATPLEGNRQGDAWIELHPSEGTVHMRAEPIAETERPVSPLAFESAAVDSSAALREAEAAGGKAYRESHSNVSVVVSGDWFGDNEMVWTVEYIESAPGTAGFWFAIHAQTGEVLHPR